jgi:hypothetical protein
MIPRFKLILPAFAQLPVLPRSCNLETMKLEAGVAAVTVWGTRCIATSHSPRLFATPRGRPGSAIFRRFEVLQGSSPAQHSRAHEDHVGRLCGLAPGGSRDEGRRRTSGSRPGSIQPVPTSAS